MVIRSEACGDGAGALMQDKDNRCCRIFVGRTSRNYILRAPSEGERDLWLKAIRKAIHENKKDVYRAVEDTITKRMRAKAAAFYSSRLFQQFVAVLLLFNFCLNVLDAEFADDREVESKAQNQDKATDGKYTKLAQYFDIADLIFTIIYILELLLNLFSNWWRPFINDGWSVHDQLSHSFP